MLTIQTHKRRAVAERELRRIVRAQQIIDQKVMLAVFGEEVYPKAEDCYRIVKEGGVYAVVVDDPSLSL